MALFSCSVNPPRHVHLLSLLLLLSSLHPLCLTEGRFSYMWITLQEFSCTSLAWQFMLLWFQVGHFWCFRRLWRLDSGHQVLLCSYQLSGFAFDHWLHILAWVSGGRRDEGGGGDARIEAAEMWRKVPHLWPVRGNSSACSPSGDEWNQAFLHSNHCKGWWQLHLQTPELEMQVWGDDPQPMTCYKQQSRILISMWIDRYLEQWLPLCLVHGLCSDLLVLRQATSLLLFYYLVWDL